MSVLETLEIHFSADLSGVTAQLVGLSAQLAGVSSQALSTAGSMRSAGALLAGSLRDGLASGLPSVLMQGRTAGSQYASGARAGLSGAKGAGYQLSAGMAAGIRSGRSAVTSAVSAVVSAALSRMRSLLKIHSPSRVTRGLGGYFGEGFAEGILGTVSLAERAAGSLSGSALNGLTAMPEAEAGMDARVRSAVESALGGVQLTVPLVVDGMKLGEASIRGINAVTKSAGKVLLNI